MSAVPREPGRYSMPFSLERSIDLSRINIEVLAWAGLVLLSIMTHLWALDRMALHHDESIHAWMSWKFLTGQGGFTCANGRSSSTYCYDPIYHGPSLYVLTLLSYFLFGDGDWEARLPQAVSGVLLVASAWWLRPYLGGRGAFVAGALLALSPTMLYFTRFARHDGLIVLFTFWMVLATFHYLDTGKPRYLYWLFISAVLAIATHELYYILFFLFGAFFGIRLLYERLPRHLLALVLLAVVLICIPFEIWNPRITPTLDSAGMAYLFMSVALGGLFVMRLWDDRPLLSDQLRELWTEQRGTLWKALGVAGVIYALLYTTFFTNPYGLLGPIDGIGYWLGKQQDYKRGDQPWYYYLMQLSIYEPLAFFGSIGATIYLYTRPGRRLRSLFRPVKRQDEDTQAHAIAGEPAYTNTEAPNNLEASGQPAAPAPVPLFPLFLAFWFTGALVGFSWAGEKMPWLTIHITLPAVLLIAYALGRLLDGVVAALTDDNGEALRYVRSRALVVPAALLILLIMLGVALWRLSASAQDQQGQANLLQGLIPLALVGVLIYMLLTIGQRIGTQLVLSLCALTVAGVLGVYTVRAAWMAVYRYPDTPREFLVFVQSSPDVPLIAREIRELAINQTRNSRSTNDPTGGLSMPVFMGTGDSSGEGSLAWPFQWYLRDFKRIEARGDEFFRSATAESFQVDSPRGGKEFAPVVMVYKPHIYESTRQALEANYVKRFDAKLNWWFPEGNKCLPDEPGYKRFYHSASTAAQIRADCNNPNIDVSKFGNVLSPFLWALDRQNWGTIGKYMIYREIPEPLRLDGREIEVWFRRDLASGGEGVAAAPADLPVKLVAEKVITGAVAGVLDQPRGIAVDAKGNVYVSDVTGHRIQVFGPDGALARTIGTLGAGSGQFNEPRALAIDTQGNLYVADTWNARVVKLDSNGTFMRAWGEGQVDFGAGRRATMTDGTEADNNSKPLGFFGPRGIAVDGRGHVYIADTGNKRVVVTDSEGNYLYQWGRPGSEPGAFNEPTSIAVDDEGNVYVADTWNGRVQVFAREENGRVNPLPSLTWRVPGWQPNTYDDPAIAVGRGDRVFVSVPNRDQAVYFNRRGDALLRWGGKGSDLASLSLPSGISVGPDGKVYIVDRGNTRVMRFEMPQVAAPATTDAPAR